MFSVFLHHPGEQKNGHGTLFSCKICHENSLAIFASTRIPVCSSKEFAEQLQMIFGFSGPTELPFFQRFTATYIMEKLELKGIHIQRGSHTVLTGIDLVIRKGDKILIQGPSGSGKSTLLRAILGFEESTRGAIIYDDVRVSSRTIRDFRSHCTYIGQTPLVYEGKVEEYLHLPFGFRRNRQESPEKDRLLMILEELGFGSDILHKEYRSLSGGEQQRITIAQALLLQRDVYFLDEVTSSLDQDNIMRVIDLFTESSTRTVIAVSHNQEWRREGIRVFELAGGQLQEEGVAS